MENYETYSTAELANLIRSIDHPNLGVCLEVSNSLGALECKDAIVELWTPFTESLEQTLALEDNWAKASVDYLSKLSLFQR